MLPRENSPWWRHDRPWGFRFSVMDVVVVVTGAVLTAVSWSVFDWFELVIPFLLGHFLLFCNTFRIGGERSLIWMVVFLANVHGLVRTNAVAVHVTIHVVVTVGLILHCVLGRNYHGLGCTWINPEGHRTGALSEGAFTRRVLLACRLPRPWIELLIGRRLDEFDEDRGE